jgi:charged multivesicular body protein 4
MIAARAALKRKKQHEHTLDQTTGQMATLEQHILAIEAANINRETLLAIERASKAMADIHGKLDINKVDETMYVLPMNRDMEREYWQIFYRDKVREQHALGEEIAQAITSAPMGEAVDEAELDDELAELEQEQLDNRMLKTGTVPVSDEIQKLPAVVNGESTFGDLHFVQPTANHSSVKGKPAEEDEEEELRKLQAEMAMWFQRKLGSGFSLI